MANEIIIPSIKNNYDDQYPLIQSHFFFTSYDPKKHFVWETIFGDDGTTIDQDKTEIEKKKAWISCFRYHFSYLRTLPTGWFTFYSVEHEWIDLNDRHKLYLTLHQLPTKTDSYNTIITPSEIDFDIGNFNGLQSTYSTLQGLTNYENATCINRASYNRAAYIHIQNHDSIPTVIFQKIIKQYNNDLGFDLPLGPGWYRFSKIKNKWVSTDTPSLQNDKLIESIPVGGD